MTKAAAAPIAFVPSAVGECDSLAQIVGYEDNGFALLVPQLEQLILQDQAGLRVERAFHRLGPR